MNEKEKMLKGQIYDHANEELIKLRAKAHKLCLKYNNTLEEDTEQRQEILREMGIKLGSNVYLQGPIYHNVKEDPHIDLKLMDTSIGGG